MKSRNSLRLTFLFLILMACPFLFMEGRGSMTGTMTGDAATCCPSENSICYFSEQLKFPGYYAIPPGRECTPPGNPGDHTE